MYWKCFSKFFAISVLLDLRELKTALRTPKLQSDDLLEHADYRRFMHRLRVHSHSSLQNIGSSFYFEPPRKNAKTNFTSIELRQTKSSFENTTTSQKIDSFFLQHRNCLNQTRAHNLQTELSTFAERIKSRTSRK